MNQHSTTAFRELQLGPRAARQAHRARRTWLALLALPVFGVFLLVEAARGVRDRAIGSRTRELRRHRSFERSASMPAPRDRSMSDIVAALESFPFRPLEMSASVAFFRDNGPDAIGALLSSNPQVTTLPHSYPAWFEHRLLTGHDGARLAGMQAMHDKPGPAIVLVHGLLMTKNFDLIIQLARRAYEQWGFHVVTVDMRGWGQSVWTCDDPSSGGYYEGRDIVEICRELHRDPRVTSVGALGYSLGGASLLNAAAVSSDSEDRPLDGGVVTVSAPADIATGLQHVSTPPGWRDHFFGLWLLFRTAIQGTVRRRNMVGDLRTWYDIAEQVLAPHYGVSIEEFCARAAPTAHVGRIDQPVLSIHSIDDFVVPVQHALLLQDATVDNENVHVMVRDAGAHCSFTAVDPAWFHSVVHRWFEYWALSEHERVAGAESDEG